MTVSSPEPPPIVPVLRHIVHPSDFSEASRVAFAHALKVALIAKSKLSLIHETDDEEREWSEFPSVLEMLRRWGILPTDSGAEAVDSLGIDVAKIIGSSADPVEGVLTYLREHEADLIVIATHRHGFDWLRKSISEPIARKSGEMTLFVPENGRTFISPDDGSVTLRNILIPVAETPAANPAIVGASRLVRQLGCDRGHVTLLHVGDKDLALETPNVPGWGWRSLHKKGNVIDVILETAQQVEADLIVMSTDGRNGFLDAIRGSHSERVLRHGVYPLLAIPETSSAAGKMKRAENVDWYREREHRTRRSAR